IRLPPGSLTSVSLRRKIKRQIKKRRFMKSIVMPSTVQLNEEAKNELTQEVEETVATEAINNKNETFTVSQMWNRQRQVRSASDRIRKWNLN
ncbi:MAG: hypothetical protein WAR38_14360, partial [Chitinophagaceae bacterium]